MKIDKISFGNVIKINASSDIAKQIADIANDKNSKRVNLRNKILEFLKDTDKTKATVFDYSRNISYIFTEKDSEEYQLYNAEYLEELDKLRKLHLSEKEQAEQRAIIYENYREKVMDIINRNYDAMTFDPRTRKGKVTSLNYIV